MAFGSFLGGFGGSVLGTAVVQIGADTKALAQGLTTARTETAKSTAATTKATQSAAAKASAAWKTFGVIIAAVFVKFAADAVRAAVEVESVMGQTAAAIESTNRKSVV